MLLVPGPLAFLLLEVAAAPDAGSDPDACYGDDEDDEHDDPLPMVGEPGLDVSDGLGQSIGVSNLTSRRRQDILLFP